MNNILLHAERYQSKLEYMAEEKIRRRVAYEAARLIYTQEETGYFQAKQKAARRIRGVGIHAGKLPGDGEILKQIPAVVEAVESLKRDHARTLKKISKKHSSKNASPTNEPFDRFRLYELLLLPLENIKEDPKTHPEGDVLYHSLQVFDLARDALPYDEEFLLAALLHDVGKAIDSRDHVAAGLEALSGHITPRTAWLIEHHTEALSLRGGTLGARSRRRLEAGESFEELMLLAECDRQGRAVGAAVADVPEALAYIRDLSESCGE
jgi:hypothetical protein